MRGDRTVHILRAPEKDWQGDPVEGSVEQREFVADDCAFIPSVNADNGLLVTGKALLAIFPGAAAIPEPDDEVEISGEGVWQMDGDVAHYTKSGDDKAWMSNITKLR